MDDIPDFAKIDRFIAERVMGYAIRTTDKGSAIETWGTVRRIPDYSTNMIAAWQVIDEMRRRDRFVKLQEFASGWQCIFRGVNGMPIAGYATNQPTAMLAICWAALMAIGVDKDEYEAS